MATMMPVPLFTKMEEPWRYNAHLVGGWCLLLERACVDGSCHNDCHWMKVGCLCEACGRSLVRMDALRTWLKTEEEYREFERREMAKGTLRRGLVSRMRRRRTRRSRVMWAYVVRRTALVEGGSRRTRTKRQEQATQSDI